MHGQKKVSTYLYQLYVTQKIQNQNAVSECESGTVFDIGHVIIVVCVRLQDCL